jgi:hypothetical protein
MSAFAFAEFPTAWASWNAAAPDRAFDPYPFIFLNLLLSMLAVVQAPIIMMSQNRQAARDRLQAEHDFEINLKAELEIMALHAKLDRLRADANESPIPTARRSSFEADGLGKVSQCGRTLPVAGSRGQRGLDLLLDLLEPCLGRERGIQPMPAAGRSGDTFAERGGKRSEPGGATGRCDINPNARGRPELNRAFC